MRLIKKITQKDMSKHYTKDSICPGGNHLIMAERGDRSALSRYGHGNICPADGTREALYGDFITHLKKQDTASAVFIAEGIVTDEPAAVVAAWQFISDAKTHRSLQGFFGRTVASLLEQGVIIPSYA